MIFNRTYGIDLGSSSIKLFDNEKNTYIIEKNKVAYEKNRIIATGNYAYEIWEKNPGNIIINNPIEGLMISNIELEEIILYKLIKRLHTFTNFGGIMYFVIPIGISGVEKRAFYNVVNGHWLRKNKVYLVEAPMADAVAIGIDIEDTIGSMVVNIGSSSTKLSIISKGQVIIRKVIPIGGANMDNSIQNEIRQRYHLQIGEKTATNLKFNLCRLNDQKSISQSIIGIDSISGLPRKEVVSSYVVNEGVMNSLDQICKEIRSFLERIPPQISYKIAKDGIYLTGGASRTPFIDNYLAGNVGFSFNNTELYEYSGVKGLEKIINTKELSYLAKQIKQRKF